MAVSRALRRLFRIRDLEEEQHRIALESAVGELHTLADTLAAVTARGRHGRDLVQSNSDSGDCTDHQAGLVEMGSALRYGTFLAPRIVAAHDKAARLREKFLEKRVERRQAETLIQETETQDAVEAGRRAQQALDEWYRSRLFRQQAELDCKENSNATALHPDRPVDQD